MLPATLLAYRVHGDTVVPRYLSERDDVWVREIAGEIDGLMGRRACEIEDVFADRLRPMAIRAGAPPRAVSGVWHVCSRIWQWRTEAPIPPEQTRLAVFEEAARARGRDEALGAAAARLGASDRDVLASLFADRPGARRLRPPAAVPSPRELVLRYNLSLLQGLLLRATRVDVLARSQVRSVVRYAKLRRLCATYEQAGDALRIGLSGPLSILRYTTKYGHALASFVPAAVATPGWSLEARCSIRDASLRLRADCTDPIASTHALPRDFDSTVERALVRDVRRLGTAWTIARETTAVQAAGRVFFPDFTLARGSDRILVEIVGYHTPEYLASKLRVLREAGLVRSIVCADESLACGSEEICAGAVLRYRRRVDARALIAAAEQMVGGAG